MIPEQTARQQIIRLSALPNPPESPDEVMAVYRERARNAGHAGRMTTWLLARCRYFPVPQEAAEAASATVAESDFAKPDRSCQFCYGTGWQQGWELITHHRTPNEGMYTSRDLIFDREDAERLDKLIDGRDQRLCSGVVRCRHCGGPPASTAAEEEPPRQDRPSARSKKGRSKFGMDDVRRLSGGDRD